MDFFIICVVGLFVFHFDMNLCFMIWYFVVFIWSKSHSTAKTHKKTLFVEWATSPVPWKHFEYIDSHTEWSTNNVYISICSSMHDSVIRTYFPRLHLECYNLYPYTGDVTTCKTLATKLRLHWNIQQMLTIFYTKQWYNRDFSVVIMMQ